MLNIIGIIDKIKASRYAKYFFDLAHFVHVTKIGFCNVAEYATKLFYFLRLQKTVTMDKFLLKIK